MKYRPLGGTGLAVSEIGFGAWGIGGASAGETSYGATDDKRSLATLAAAFDCGVTFYDTAPAYGDGHSEELVGAAFVHRRDAVIIATKAGIEHFGQAPDFSPSGLRRSLEHSLARLKTDYVDLFQLHNPPPDLFTRAPESFDALQALVAAGRIRSFGVSVKGPDEALEMLRSHAIPCVQINFNMLDTRVYESGLLKVLSDRGVGVIARTPLCFGFLSGAVTVDTQFPEGDHRRRWPRAQLQRWVDGARTMHEAAQVPSDQTRTQAALRFCLSFPMVSVVIPGIMTPKEAAENAEASTCGPLSEATCERILTLNRQQSFFIQS